MRALPTFLHLLSLFPFSSPSRDHQEQNNKILFQDPARSPGLETSDQPPPAAPHPRYEAHWSALVLAAEADCGKRTLIRSLSKQVFGGHDGI
jgi:hypothetical protein